MIERTPPPWAVWLLEHWGSAYHGESLSGDLIEQYQEGRSPAWFWGQALAAVVIARAGALRTLPWSAAGKWLSRLLAETAALLAVLAAVDHERRVGSFGGMNATLISIIIALIGAALVGYWASHRLGTRKRGHAAINASLLALVVIALGLGTVAWADAVRAGADRAEACLRPGN